MEEMARIVPEWITIHRSEFGVLVKMDRSADLKAVRAKIEAELKKPLQENNL